MADPALGKRLARRDRAHHLHIIFELHARVVQSELMDQGCKARVSDIPEHANAPEEDSLVLPRPCPRSAATIWLR